MRYSVLRVQTLRELKLHKVHIPLLLWTLKEDVQNYTPYQS